MVNTSRTCDVCKKPIAAGARYVGVELSDEHNRDDDGRRVLGRKRRMRLVRYASLDVCKPCAKKPLPLALVAAFASRNG